QRLRAMIRGSLPVEAMPEGLRVALTDLAAECAARYDVPCRFECDPPVAIGQPTVAIHLYRIAQEAVTNAVRHGNPTQVTIRLAQVDRRLEMLVIDDGRGLEEKAAAQFGLGLESMRQRARLLRGDCSIQPRDGGGTVVTCWVPLPVE